MANITWDGGTSTDADVDANWVGGSKPTPSDVAVFDSNAQDTCQLTAPVTWAGVSCDNTFDQNFDQNGQKLTCSGSITFDGDGTNTVTLDGLIDITGDASFVLESGVSTYTISGSACELRVEGTGNIQNNSGLDVYVFAKIISAYPGKTVTHNGNNYLNTKELELKSGEWVNSGLLQVDIETTNALTFDASHTISGVSQFRMRAVSTTDFNVPQINASGHTGVIYIGYHAGGSGTINMQGNITCNNLYIRKNNAGATQFNTNDYNIIGSGLIFVGNGDATNDLNIYFGSSTIHFAESFSDPYNSGTTNLYLETSQHTYGSSVTITSNTKVTAGTSQITIDGGPCSFTSDGETFNDLIINCAGQTVTLQDTMALSGDLTLTAGNLDCNGQDISYNDIVVNSTGTLTFDGTTTQSGSGTYNQDITFNRLILTGDTNQTIAAGKTVTLTNYTATDMDGETWLSGTAGTAANLNVPAGGITVSNCTFTDIDASGGGSIDADDGTNDSGGGNTNIDFVGTLSVSPSSASAGTTITISDTGNALSPTTGVTIDGTACSNVSVIDKQTVTAEVPGEISGSDLDIVVQTSDQNYTISSAFDFISGGMSSLMVGIHCGI